MRFMLDILYINEDENDAFSNVEVILTIQIRLVITLLLY